MIFREKYFENVASTMIFARDAAEHGENEGLVVVADAQTQGRGQSNHAWFSPPGQSLYCSILLRPPLLPIRSAWVGMIAALAVCDTIDRAAQVRILSQAQNIAPAMHYELGVKWFNDINLNNRKVCGILTESVIMGENIDFMILGIGLNVNTRFETAPDDVKARASSLSAELGGDYDRRWVLSCLLESFSARYERLKIGNSSPKAEYASRLHTLGKRVTWVDGVTTDGIAENIDEDGALLVRCKSADGNVFIKRCVHGVASVVAQT
jgi:BirA family biotin operon repressor/biotin-[acetyl-CoA-carboxylase] ligase